MLKNTFPKKKKDFFNVLHVNGILYCQGYSYSKKNESEFPYHFILTEFSYFSVIAIMHLMMFDSGYVF